MSRKKGLQLSTLDLIMKHILQCDAETSACEMIEFNRSLGQTRSIHHRLDSRKKRTRTESTVYVYSIGPHSSKWGNRFQTQCQIKLRIWHECVSHHWPAPAQTLGERPEALKQPIKFETWIKTSPTNSDVSNIVFKVTCSLYLQNHMIMIKTYHMDRGSPYL